MTAINDINEGTVARFKAHEGQAPNMLNLYQQLATATAVYPGAGTPMGLVYAALKMNGEAGEFAEHVGKAMRDDALLPKTVLTYESSGSSYPVAELSGTLTPERHALLVKEAGDVLWYLSAACNELGISLSDAARANLEKLADRAARGALQGSGDNR